MSLFAMAYAVSLVGIGVLLILQFRLRMIGTFSMFAYLSVLVMLRPMLILSGLDTPQMANEFTDLNAAATEALLIAMVWGVVFTLIAYASRGRFGRALSWAFPMGPAEPDLRRVVFVAIALTLLSLGITMALLGRFGGFSGMIYAAKIEKALTGQYLLRQIALLSAIVSAYGLLVAAPLGRRRLTVLFAAMVLANLFANFAWGARGPIAYLFLAMLLAWHVRISPLRLSKVVVMFVVLGTCLALLGEVRKAAVVSRTGADWGADSVVAEVSRSLHLAEFDALALAVQDAGDKFEFRMGADLVNGALAMVPRSILPNRQAFNVGAWFRQIYQPGVINGWPVTVIGDWYVNFSYVGVLFGAVLSGFVAGAMDIAYRNPRANTWHAVFGPVLGLLMFDGGVGPGTPQQIVLTIIPLTLLGWFLRLNSGTARSRR